MSLSKWADKDRQRWGRMIKSDINFLSPVWPEKQKNDLQWLRYCSCCFCYPAAFQWRHEWDRTDNLPDLYARRGNFRSPGKRRVAQRPPTVKQGADSADKRTAEAGCRRSKGICSCVFNGVFIFHLQFLKTDFSPPFICIPIAMSSLFNHILYLDRKWAMCVCSLDLSPVLGGF